MSAPLVPLEKLFKQMAETMQAEQNKFDQAVYQSASPTHKNASCKIVTTMGCLSRRFQKRQPFLKVLCIPRLRPGIESNDSDCMH